MADKPVQIKEFNGVDYDNIYPKTTLDQVNGAQAYIDSKTLKTLYSNNMSFNDQAWEGSINIPDEIVSNMATSNFLSFELVFCRGLILRYQASNGGSIGISLESTGDMPDYITGGYTLTSWTPEKIYNPLGDDVITKKTFINSGEDGYGHDWGSGRGALFRQLANTTKMLRLTKWQNNWIPITVYKRKNSGMSVYFTRNIIFNIYRI